jgi:hypothetical protein
MAEAAEVGIFVRQPAIHQGINARRNQESSALTQGISEIFVMIVKEEF